MATREQLKEDLSWDINRLSVNPDERGSEAALAVLDDIEDQGGIIERMRAYAGAGDDVTKMVTKNLLRALQLADGRLALVTWASTGITSIGYLPNEQRFDAGQFSGIDKRMGNEYETYEQVSRAQARDLLSWTTPAIVARDEAKLLPDLDDVEVTA